MSLISLLVTLIVIGMLLWAANSIIPMEPTIKRIVNVVVGRCGVPLVAERLRSAR
jgi:hypothetical protein